MKNTIWVMILLLVSFQSPCEDNLPKAQDIAPDDSTIEKRIKEETHKCREKYNQPEDEKELTDCLNKATDRIFSPSLGSFETPYILMDFDMGRTNNKTNLDGMETEDTEIRIDNRYDLIMPFSLMDLSHSLVLQVEIDFYIVMTNSTLRLPPIEGLTSIDDETSSTDGGLDRMSFGGTYKIPIGRNGRIDISSFFDTIRNTDEYREEDDREWHQQLRGGIEYDDDNQNLSLNYHLPLSSWIYIKNLSKESALGGIDAGWSRTIGILTLTLQGEHIFKEKPDPSKSTLSLGLKVHLDCATNATLTASIIDNGDLLQTTDLLFTSSWDSRCPSTGTSDE